MRRLIGAALILLPCVAMAIFDSESISANRWRCPIYNDGRWGIDITQANFPGGYWPAPTKNYYIFGSGLWIGAMVHGETLVSVGYNPNTGGTEFDPTLCRYWRGGYHDSADRIYTYPRDWPPPLTRFPMAPQTRVSDQDVWCCFGDSDPARHDTGGVHGPLGVDVALTVYGYSDTASSDFFFLKYLVMNNNDYALDNAYVGFVMDADIGAGTDDLVGLIRDKLFHVQGDTIRVKNTGFVYDLANYESPSSKWKKGTPGMVAVSLLSSPEGLNLSAIKKFTIDIDPPHDDFKYQTMAGYNYLNGMYAPFDSLDSTPADKRLMEACGPATLPAHSADTFRFAVIASPFGDSGERGPKHDTSALALEYRQVMLRYQQPVGVAEVPAPKPPERFAVHGSIFARGAPLRISIPGEKLAAIRVYNLEGRAVRTLTGRGTITWTGQDDQGRLVPAGVYLLKPVGLSSEPTKVVLLR